MHGTCLKHVLARGEHDIVAGMLQYSITYNLHSVIHISVQLSSFYIQCVIFLFSNRHFIFNVLYFCSAIVILYSMSHIFVQ